MLQVSGHSADMPLDIPPVERCWDPTGRMEADNDEAACAAGSGALQHESSELPDGDDEAAFLHKQDPGDARRVPSSAACLPSPCLALTCAAASSSMARRCSSPYRITSAAVPAPVIQYSHCRNV